MRCFTSFSQNPIKSSFNSIWVSKISCPLVHVRYARTLANGDDRSKKATQNSVIGTVTNGSPRTRRQAGPSLRSRSQFQRLEEAKDRQSKQQAQPSMPLAVKSVKDLEKILPNMPPDEQARIRALIDEYGDSLNQSLEHAIDMSSAGTLEDEDGRNSLTTNPTSTNEYEAAIGVLTEMAEYILEQENEGHQVDNDIYVKLWSSVKMFSKITPDPNVEPPLQVLVILFQLAKAQSSPRVRRQAIKSVGDILYSYQLVRLDPYNEVDYLSALTKSRNVGRAIKIWESRLSKEDVKGSIWWLEVGTCLYQEAHDLAKAEKLALELKKRFDYVPPKVITRFIKHYLGMRNSNKAWEWYQYMISAVRQAGGPGEPESVTGDLSPEEAEVIFNRQSIPAKSDLLFVLDLFLKSLNSSYSIIIINDLCELGIQIPQSTILTNLETVAKNVVRLDEATTKEMISISAPKESQSLEHNHALLSNVIQTLSEANPELLDNQRFYTIWIAALANMNQLGAALQVLEKMLERDISPPPLAFHSVLKSLLLQGRVEFAFQVLEFMETSGVSGSMSESGHPNASSKATIPAPLSMHYALFIQYGARRSKHSFVLNILDRMAERNVRHDQSTYLALFYYRYRSRDFIGFFQLLNDAINVNKQQFSTEGYRVIWIIIRDYYRSPASSKSANPIEADLKTLFIRMLQSKDFFPVIDVYEPALHALLRANAIPEAFAAILFLGNHNMIELNPLFCFNLTRAAQKTAQSNAREGTAPSSGAPKALSLSEIALERALASISGNQKVPDELAKLKIAPEVLIQALCTYLKIDYEAYASETETILKQFLLAQQK